MAEAKSKLLVAKTKAMEMKAKVMQDVTPAQMRADRKAMYEMVCKQVRPPNLPSHLGGGAWCEVSVRSRPTCAASPPCSVILSPNSKLPEQTRCNCWALLGLPSTAVCVVCVLLRRAQHTLRTPQ